MVKLRNRCFVESKQVFEEIREVFAAQRVPGWFAPLLTPPHVTVRGFIPILGESESDLRWRQGTKLVGKDFRSFQVAGEFLPSPASASCSAAMKAQVTTTKCALSNSPVSLVVHGHDVHGDVVLLVRVQAGNLDSHGGKHPPEVAKKKRGKKVSTETC